MLGKFYVRSLPSVLLMTILPFLPAALSLAFIWLSFGTSIMNFMPHYDVDQYIYWHEMATFARNYFNGGYYGFNELLSPLKGFGPHGIGMIIIYGTLYKLMPWLGYAAIPVINIALLTIALVGYVWISRPKLGQAFIVIFAITLYPPIFLYLPTSFQEGFHYAAAVVLAMVFIHLIQHGEKSGKIKFKIASGMFLLLLCYVRYTWLLCFVPYFYIIMSGYRWRLPLAFAITIFISLAVVWTFNLFVPAWYTSSKSGVYLAGPNLMDKCIFIYTRFASNIRSILDYHNNIAASAVLYGMMMFLVIGALVALLHASRNRGDNSPGAVILLLISLNILGLIGIFTVLWTGSGSNLVRLLSSNYIFCFIVAYHFFPKRIFHMNLSYNAIILPLYMGMFQVYHLPGYINHEARVVLSTFEKQSSPFLSSRDTLTPWDRTIFVNVHDQGIAFLGIPTEFGIQTTGGKDKYSPRFSKYALTSSPPDSVGAIQWKPLTETVIGTLYVRRSTVSGDKSDKGSVP